MEQSKFPTKSTEKKKDKYTTVRGEMLTRSAKERKEKYTPEWRKI